MSDPQLVLAALLADDLDSSTMYHVSEWLRHVRRENDRGTYRPSRAAVDADGDQVGVCVYLCMYSCHIQA